MGSLACSVHNLYRRMPDVTFTAANKKAAVLLASNYEYADDVTAENFVCRWDIMVRQLEIDDVISLLRGQVKRAGGVVAWSAKAGILEQRSVKFSPVSSRRRRGSSKRWDCVLSL